MVRTGLKRLTDRQDSTEEKEGAAKKKLFLEDLKGQARNRPLENGLKST